MPFRGEPAAELCSPASIHDLSERSQGPDVDRTQPRGLARGHVLHGVVADVHGVLPGEAEALEAGVEDLPVRLGWP